MNKKNNLLSIIGLIIISNILILGCTETIKSSDSKSGGSAFMATLTPNDGKTVKLVFSEPISSIDITTTNVRAVVATTTTNNSSETIARALLASTNYVTSYWIEADNKTVYATITTAIDTGTYVSFASFPNGITKASGEKYSSPFVALADVVGVATKPSLLKADIYNPGTSLLVIFNEYLGSTITAANFTVTTGTSAAAATTANAVTAAALATSTEVDSAGQVGYAVKLTLTNAISSGTFVKVTLPTASAVSDVAATANASAVDTTGITNSVVDTAKPIIASVSADDGQTVRVVFNEALSAADITKFTVKTGTTGATTANVVTGGFVSGNSAGYGSTVFLTLTTALTNAQIAEVTLAADAVSDFTSLKSAALTTASVSTATNAVAPPTIARIVSTSTSTKVYFSEKVTLDGTLGVAANISTTSDASAATAFAAGGTFTATTAAPTLSTTPTAEAGYFITITHAALTNYVNVKITAAGVVKDLTATPNGNTANITLAGTAANDSWKLGKI